MQLLHFFLYTVVFLTYSFLLIKKSNVFDKRASFEWMNVLNRVLQTRKNATHLCIVLCTPNIVNLFIYLHLFILIRSTSHNKINASL